MEKNDTNAEQRSVDPELDENSSGNSKQEQPESAEQKGSSSSEEVTVAQQLLVTLLTERFDRQLLKMDDISERQNQLAADFASKLKYDEHKDKIIDDLHRELQEYKKDLYQKIMQPMVLDMINTIDNVKKQLSVHKLQEELNAEALSDMINGYIEDLDNILFRQNVERFSFEEGALFDATKQSILSTLQTEDPLKDKTVAETRREGYMWGEKVVRPAKIVAYKFIKESSNI